MRDSRLVNLFGLDSRADAILALRRILLNAIESLKPDDDVPAQSRSWSYYHILSGRYKEQFTQVEVGSDLGLSVRQLRRQEKRALQVLADRLWTRYNLDDDEAEAVPQLAVLGREEELAWSQAAFPSESVAVDALIQSALETAEPMIQSSNLQVTYTASAGLPRLAVQLVPMRQALLNILTIALDWLPAGQLTIRAEHQPKEARLQISIVGDGTLSSSGAGDGGGALASGE